METHIGTLRFYVKRFFYDWKHLVKTFLKKIHVFTLDSGTPSGEYKCRANLRFASAAPGVVP